MATSPPRRRQFAPLTSAPHLARGRASSSRAAHDWHPWFRSAPAHRWAPCCAGCWPGVSMRVFPALPLGTLAANLVGGYLIGVAVAVFAGLPDLSPQARLFVVTGFLGGLTTFSTFSAEVVTQLQQGHTSWALATTLAHLLGSFAFTALGIATVAGCAPDAGALRQALAPCTATSRAAAAAPPAPCRCACRRDRPPRTASPRIRCARPRPGRLARHRHQQAGHRVVAAPVLLGQVADVQPRLEFGDRHQAVEQPGAVVALGGPGIGLRAAAAIRR